MLALLYKWNFKVREQEEESKKEKCSEGKSSSNEIQNIYRYCLHVRNIGQFLLALQFPQLRPIVQQHSWRVRLDDSGF